MTGSTYSMVNISQYQAGLYICQASNGVGYPVLQHINLTVLCKLKMNLVFIFYCIIKFSKENIRKIETYQPKRKVDGREKNFLALTNCTFMSTIRQRHLFHLIRIIELQNEGGERRGSLAQTNQSLACI